MDDRTRGSALDLTARLAIIIARPLKSQPASTFLIVPFVSWVAMVVVAALGTFRARRA